MFNRVIRGALLEAAGDTGKEDGNNKGIRTASGESQVVGDIVESSAKHQKLSNSKGDCDESDDWLQKHAADYIAEENYSTILHEFERNQKKIDETNKLCLKLSRDVKERHGNIVDAFEDLRRQPRHIDMECCSIQSKLKMILHFLTSADISPSDIVAMKAFAKK